MSNTEVLTRAQIAGLRELEFAHTRVPWTHWVQWLLLPKTRSQTLDALVVRGLIAREGRMEQHTYFSLTDKGRQALLQYSKEGA